MLKLTAVICLSCVLLSGCGLSTGRLYEGPELKPNEESVISSVGIYPERALVLRVKTIDGNAVEQTRTSEFLIRPGRHDISVEVQKDRKVSMLGGVITDSSLKATILVTLHTEPGHTYIPNARIEGEKAYAVLEDAGVDFNRECMPLRRFAVAYGGSSDGKKAGCYPKH